MIVPNDVGAVQVRYEPFVEATCSIAHDKYVASIVIEYGAGPTLLEFMAFERWLKVAVTIKEYSIEQLVRMIYDMLVDVLKPRFLNVEVKGEASTHYRASALISSMGEPKG